MAGYRTRLLVSKHAFSWAKLQGMTSFSVYFAYFQPIFTRCWGCYEPAVSIPIFLRPIDCEELYGRFLNTVRVNASINVSSSLESVVQSYNRIVFDVIEHSGLPYESSLEAAEPNVCLPRGEAASGRRTRRHQFSSPEPLEQCQAQVPSDLL